MKLSRTVGYALQAMVQLAATEDDGPVSCRRLAEAGGMPERFLLQILRSLVTNGLLESTRGVEGGYRLARNAEDISVLDILEAIDGPLSLGLPQGWENGSVDEALSRCGDRVRGELDRLKLTTLAVSMGDGKRALQPFASVGETVEGNVAAASF
ncbi:MAG: Rrf2 family transcriptional regulator [Pirellulales bacterium]